LERERANDFPGVGVKETSRGSRLGLHSPVIDLGPHAICNLSAQTSNQADKTRIILDINPIQDRTHLQTLVQVEAVGMQFVLLRTSRLVRYDDLSSQLSLGSDLSLTTT
jgi:hypothetical protein